MHDWNPNKSNFTQQNNQIFMYYQHNILLHATAHIIDANSQAISYNPR